MSELLFEPAASSELLVAQETTNSVSELDRWMAVLAHELRGPLNTMTLALEGITMKRQATDTALDFEDLARGAARQMRHVIDDVLDLCRHRNGGVSRQMETLNLAEVVMSAVRNAKPMIHSKGHHLLVSMPEDEVAIQGQRGRIEQVLTNLLANAAHYTPSNGDIVLSVEQIVGSVVIRVRDNGIGIPQSLLPHVFDYYRRGKITHDNPLGGLGIGLALVKQLVELHGGTVSAHSDGYDLGAEFAVRLPVDLH